MSHPAARLSRRRLLKRTGAAGVVVGTPFLPVAVRAQEELPRLPVDNPTAKALMYAEDADSAEQIQAARSENAYCYNCRFFEGEDGQEKGFAGCMIFPEFRVAALGWCNTWTEVDS